MTDRPAYMFDRSTEGERLIQQGKIFDPATRRLLHDAGLSAGMRVLDLGSGVGNVAYLAAEIVGPTGSVLGIDRDPDLVETATRMASDLGLTNVRFQVADVQTLETVEAGFDAVIGRLILLHVKDPVSALKAAIARTRPGGLICMEEPDLTYPWSAPQLPLWAQVRQWVLDTMAKAGVEPNMALRLFSDYTAAGLPLPQLRMSGILEGGPQARVYGWANMVKSVTPLIERMGVATSAEVDAATLEQRLFAEISANNGVWISPPMVGAWATVPAP